MEPLSGTTFRTDATPVLWCAARSTDPRRCGARVVATFCLGMALARLELTTVLGRFAERFPNATFASPPVRRNTTGLAGFASLELIIGD